MTEPYLEFAQYLYEIGILWDSKLIESLEVISKCKNITSNPERKKYWNDKLREVFWSRVNSKL